MTGINNNSNDPTVGKSGDKGAHSVVEGGAAIRAQDASKRKSGAAIRADGRGKRAKIIGPPEREDAHETQTEHCQTTTMRDGNVRGQRIINEKVGTHALEDIGAKTDDAFPTIHTRTSPAIFVKAVSGLSEDQKRAVRELGLGCLLDLTITSTPAKMGYWLVDNFNHMDRKLQLYDGGKVHVKEDDVYSALGLPRGSIEIANRKKKTESGVLNEWADMYGVSVATKITATKVLEMIQNCERSDDWFKRHFVVLMVTCLFESSQNGVANLRTVHLLNDLSNVSKMNWCAYLIRCLVSAKKAWNANRKRKNFTGPLLFLTLFYVDKVVLSYRIVKRSLPIFKSWNNIMLKARERDEIVVGAFGRGYVEKDRHRAEIDVGSPNDNDTNRASKLSAQAFIQEFASKTRVLATAGIEIIQLVENAPRDLLGDENFTKMQGAAQKLLGICNEDSKEKDKQHMPDQPSQHATDELPFKAPTQIVDDDFWNDPANIAAIDAIVDAVARRDRFKRMHHEGPSYSLGLGLSSDEEEDDTGIDHHHTTPPNVSAGHHVDEVAVGEPSTVHVPSVDCDAVVNEPVVDTVNDPVQGASGDTIVDAGGDTIVDDAGVVDVGRPKRSPKLSSFLKSPFKQRCIDVVKKLDKQENMVVNWVLCKADDDVIIYQSMSGKYIVKRDVVACLAPNMPINEALIDLWARIMNCNEKIGSRGSVACFFATTRPCNELFFKGKRKKDVSYKKFVEMLDADINGMCAYNRKKVSMYVFPIHSGGFSGLICILPDTWKIHILDSACICKDASIKKSVTSHARILQQSLAKYMAQMSMSKSSKSVALSIPNFIDLPWTEGVDDVDAGVLTMRHMETFKGRDTEGWNPDVKKADKRQIDLMRKRYCYVIAFAPYNKVKDANLVESKRSPRKKVGVV